MRRVLAMALIAAGTFGLLGTLGAPVQAATRITASFSVTRTTSGPALYNLRTLVKLPMSRADAEGYLWNGARIELRFYGDDPVSDDFLIGPIIYVRSATGLSATDEGIVLDAQWQEAPGSWLNEDDGFFDGRVDEIYVKARWVDGDGAALETRSNVVTGIF